MSDLGSCANAPPRPRARPVCASATVGGPTASTSSSSASAASTSAACPTSGAPTCSTARRSRSSRSRHASLRAPDHRGPHRREPDSGSGANPVRGGFGRTATNPRGLTPCAGNSGVGECKSQIDVPPAVRIGDFDGGGVGDIVVGANMFPETGATAHPDSQCAAEAGAATCVGAGRVYVYRGEEIAGSNPAEILDGSGPGETMPRIHKNIGAQTDDLFSGSPGHIVENFGHSQIPIGDVGTCQTGGAFPPVVPGQRCLRTSRTNVPDGKPDYVSRRTARRRRSSTPTTRTSRSARASCSTAPPAQSSTSTTIPSRSRMPCSGSRPASSSRLEISATRLARHRDPRDAGLAGQAEAGRGYVFSGNVASNMINFAFINDPTPNTFGRFANPTEGVGDLVQGTQVRNEVLAGQFSAVQSGGKADTNST